MRRDKSYQARKQKLSGEEGRQEISGGQTGTIRRGDKCYQEKGQYLSGWDTNAIRKEVKSY